MIKNVETLKQMSDEELNELAATEVMGWNVVKYSREDMLVGWHYADKNGMYVKGSTWDPIYDMNDAMELISKPEIMDRIQIGVYPTSFGKWISRAFMPGFNINVMDDSPSRAITLASILAKGEDKVD